ncbi:MAG: YafY family transcriptional regulator [Candidatus Zixiibacteriota bacterium]|nr:MAG: YafY family transcriptional regulator [candidate division Zixibacteria bacterium]
MRRADRLFSLIQILRRSGLTTAAQLVRDLEVSVRTVYRDIQDLISAGVPIEGEAGVGYLLADSYDLPPLMFTRVEIEALALGARMVACWGDKELAGAADSILSKVDAVLPNPLKHTLDSTSLFSLSFQNTDIEKRHLAALREATRERRKVRLLYTDANTNDSTRVIRPLCLSFFAPRWIVTGWCEWRDNFRNFRLDRIRRVDVLDDTFDDEPGKTLNDYITMVTS